jgi:hypothetical protein
VLEVQRQVLVATGVELRPELRMVGFGEPESRASGDSGLASGERGA